MNTVDDDLAKWKEKVAIILDAAGKKYLNIDSNQNEAINLHHYTSLDGAYQIIKNGNIRLTNILYLNDPNELYDGLDIYMEAIIGLRESYSCNCRISFILSKIHHIIIDCLIINTSSKFIVSKRKADDLDKKCKIEKFDFSMDTLSVYVAAFCSKESESLRHWVHYGDNAKGVCLEFEAIGKNNLHYLNNNSNISEQDKTQGSDIIAKVCYASDKNKKEFVNEFLNKTIEKINDNDNDSDELFVKKIIFIADQICQHCIVSKNQSYSDENEYRLFVICHSDRKHEYRINNNNLLIPYIDNYLFDKGVLKGVILGSLNNEELNTSSFKGLLKQCEYEDVEVTMSPIKYRG